MPPPTLNSEEPVEGVGAGECPRRHPSMCRRIRVQEQIVDTTSTVLFTHGTP